MLPTRNRSHSLRAPRHRMAPPARPQGGSSRRMKLMQPRKPPPAPPPPALLLGLCPESLLLPLLPRMLPARVGRSLAKILLPSVVLCLCLVGLGLGRALSARSLWTHTASSTCLRATCCALRLRLGPSKGRC
eukprot:Rmarinus@m.12897